MFSQPVISLTSSLLPRRVWLPLAFLPGLLLGQPAREAPGNALEAYVRRADTNFAWRKIEQRQTGGATVTRLELISQAWRGKAWRHTLLVVRPAQVRNPGWALLDICGDGSGNSQLPLLQKCAERAGAMAAALTSVPFQPQYGRREDALVAYTFDQYTKTGDETWPVLFPMVKSATRAMDALQAFAQQEYQVKLDGFVLTGASKRGWTTWLTGAVDERVKAIAPMVFDMLNMKAQTDWAAQAYGRQSERISDYTDLDLTQRLGEPAMVKLCQWVDPYAYRERYRLPKLVLIGTNDPYWVVDALRHYWEALPAPKLVFQTPNGKHDLQGGREAYETLATFFQMVADKQALPQLTWTFFAEGQDKAGLTARFNQPAKSARLWTADSKDRDFRKARWTSRPLDLKPDDRQIQAEVQTPAKGYRAYLLEVSLVSPTGQEYKLSTEARVTPEGFGRDKK
jgi:PhoPQ-activated pathogenicity-related protein